MTVPGSLGMYFIYMFLANIKFLICTPSIAHCLYPNDLFLIVNFQIFISDP